MNKVVVIRRSVRRLTYACLSLPPIIGIPFLVLALVGCASVPQSQSARRYVDINEWPDASGKDDLTESRYYLLDRREVQRELDLTDVQLAALAKAFNTPFKNMPGFDEWRRQDQALSKEEKLQKRDQRHVEIKAINTKWLESHLAEILTSRQKTRLDGLLLQMKGPRAILVVPGVAESLHLTEDQRTNIQGVVDEYLKDLQPFLERYGHTMLQKTRRSQTMSEFVREQDALLVVITEILKARDEGIVCTLTPDQSEQWDKLQGRCVPVSWPPHAFFYIPFMEEKKPTANDSQ
jgi:hypothetical protein